VEERERKVRDVTSAAAREAGVEGTRREVGRLELLVETEGRVVCKHDGTLLETSAVAGQLVRTGDRLGSVEAGGGEGEMHALIYFSVKDGKRVAPGMEVRVSPDPVERTRHGSLRARILSVSAYPVLTASVAAAVGNPETARTLVEGGPRIEVVARLEADPRTPSGYAWTSSLGPPHGLSPGTTASGQATVEARAPISFILPFLRELTGVE
jgi:HlyD family secretion protein